MTDIVFAALHEARVALADLIENQDTQERILTAGRLLASAFKNGHRVYSCGNGGSHCDAMHFAEELTGRFRRDRPPLAATAISDPSHMSCVSNDFGFDQVFARYVEAHAREGDVLLAISTSGGSLNVLNAAAVARAKRARVIALTGRPDAKLAAHADIHIATPGGRFADRVQELHIKVIHMLIEIVELELFPELGQRGDS